MTDYDKLCKNRIQATITIILTIGGLVVMYFLFTRPIPEENKTILYTIIGSCTTVYLGCMAYWFGSSHSEADKDRMLFNSTPIDTNNKVDVNDN